MDTEQPPQLPFSVVGIGASAGGLEAVMEFLSAIRADSGMAYVFIQHLPPTGESMLAPILSKRSALPVLDVENEMPVQVNHLYVIRPGRTLRIHGGKFELGDQVVRPMHSRPVDDFFKSLAEEQRERAIAVILSGMGSNGTAGAQAIKAVGGLCIAQDPESAQFPSMPRHLVDAGYADFILAPQDMADVLLAYAGHPYANGQREQKAVLAQRDQQHIREILAVLRTRTRHDFNGYKKPTVLRRIQRRMGLNRLETLSEYARLLRQSPTEVAALADDLLIHVTGFFRDAEAWDALRQEVIVPLIESREIDESIRCWVTACSSGEEAYTLAILLVEECERVQKPMDIKVFATDMAERTLQNARSGLYPGGIESEITPARLERFFQKEDAVYRVRQDLRERVVFAPQNVLQDPPFSRLDIASCRNLLIYLEPETQQRLLGLLHFGLRDGGTLFLGTSETAGIGDLFEPINKRARIYLRIGPTRHGSVDFPLPPALGGKSDVPNPAGRLLNPRPSVAQLTSRALLDRFTPPAVTIDRDQRILYYHGDTQPYLVTPRGEPTRDLMLLTRDSVRSAVRTAVQRAIEQNASVTVQDGFIDGGAEGRVRIEVTVSPLDSKNTTDYLLVTFHQRIEATGQPSISPVNGNGKDTTDELHRVRDELQSTIEELQASSEGSRAYYEEVISTNEELQSTNEELETSKEEMQSLNEELSTVNAQLHAKMEEHQTAHNDLASLLVSTEIAVLFLDTSFRLRRFTPKVLELMNVIQSDLGRPVGDLARKFTDPELLSDTESVLGKLAPIEREIAADGGRWYMRRITPYRTADNRIDGTVVTFLDITARRRTEDALRASEGQFRRSIEEAPIPVIMQAEDGRVLQISRAWTELTGYEPAELPTLDAWMRHLPGIDVDALRRQLDGLFQGRTQTAVVEFAIRSRDGVQRQWSFSASSPGTLRDGRRFIVGMAVDITDRHRDQLALAESEERFRLLVEGAHDFAMLMLDPSGRITAWNDGAQRLLGSSAEEAVGQPAAIIFTPEDRAVGGPEQELATARDTGRATDERWHLRKDGSRFWGSGVMTALRYPDGSLRGFVKVMRDETARKQAEDALQESKAAAEMANRMKDEFLATLSHELRTPLSAILLWGKMLQGGVGGTGPLANDEQDLKEGLAAILQSAEAQKELIEDLLDLSRISSGNLRLQVREIDLLPVVRAAVDAVSPAADAKGVAVEINLGLSAGIVRADPDRLRQVIWNLLFNAVKFTPAGGQVTVTLSRDAGQIEIRVTDTGKGISAEFLPHVFDRFRQAEGGTTRLHGGLGLGLAIAKQLVELHGGSILAESPGVNQGATFIVRLPLPSVHKRALRNKPLLAKTGDELAPARLKGLRVLIVEDDLTTRSAVAILLRSRGAMVTEADSAVAAFASFTRSPPEVIVSDIGMPGEDGYALIRRIRQHEATAGMPPIPAIALTAFARETDHQMALEAGFQRHLDKPVEPEYLTQVLEELARNSV